MAERNNTAWRGVTGGTPWMQRMLIRLLRVLPLGFSYGVMSVAIPFYVLLDRRGRQASYRFFRRRMGQSPLRSLIGVFRNMYNMGKVVIDRFAAYGGKRFDLVYQNREIYFDLADAPGAFMMLGSHVGNFEMVGYMLPSPRATKVLVYGGETATVMQNRNRMFAETRIEMVPVQKDLTHIFVLNNALADGEIVSVPADRPYGSSKVIRLPFFGEEAAFPAGPFTLATRREVPVIVAFALKESRKRYRIIMERLQVPEGTLPADEARALAAAYVAVLERIVRQWPEQWYNFYDFWAA